MVTYRRFLNTDPPRLVKVWNDAFTNRGAVRLANSSPLETFVFSKSYFDPQGLVLAEVANEVIGFGHAGFAPDDSGERLSTETGVISMVAVHSTYRRRGIGTELVHLCEAYVKDRGAKTVLAGPPASKAPFYLGLYGGSEISGFLVSDASADPFFHKLGYTLSENYIVFQRQLQQPIRVIDPRFAPFRQRFEMAVVGRKRPTWWQNCIFANIEPWEFNLIEKETKQPVAQALLTELEGFSWRWNQPAIGILSFNVDPEHRRQGVGKFFLGQLLRFLQDQCFQIAEVHASETNQPALQLCRMLGFEQVDIGKVYSRQLS